MLNRLSVGLVLLVLVTSCSLSDNGVTKTVEISPEKMAEIKAKPYIGGNGPGGFSTAALLNVSDESSPHKIHFTGFGPYLHEMGFKNNMTITAIDGVAVAEVFDSRWRVLRLKDSAAYDAEHYRDLIQYIFTRESVDHVVLTIENQVSATSIVEGQLKKTTEVWRINFQR